VVFKNKNMKNIIAVIILAILTIVSKAQPFSTGGFKDDPQYLSIFGGIILLASAGVAYGYKKLKDKG
jgi:hypothetical protein